MSAGFPAFRRHVTDTRAADVADAAGGSDVALIRRRENTKHGATTNILKRKVQTVAV